MEKGFVPYHARKAKSKVRLTHEQSEARKAARREFCDKRRKLNQNKAVRDSP